MILVIDNYDSFTYNLVQYLGELGSDIKVLRNDAISAEEALELNPSHLIISPGPGTPEDSGISKKLITTFAGKIPILGVCLGHQTIGEIYGAKVVKAPYLMHGKTSEIIFSADEDLFYNIDNPFCATRYHSLIIDKASLEQTPLQVTAWTSDGVVMAIRHKEHKNLLGVQFHPESILTKAGKNILSNFLSLKD